MHAVAVAIDNAVLKMVVDFVPSTIARPNDFPERILLYCARVCCCCCCCNVFMFRNAKHKFYQSKQMEIFILNAIECIKAIRSVLKRKAKRKTNGTDVHGGGMVE